jgi:type IV pilus assembly protein PilB
MDGITQVQVNEKTGLTFTEALRSILRQDPDKIMVGEIRDFPTAELAIRAALTGHLVLSTLHTNDAPSSVVRLLDMGIAPYMISSSLVAVVAQRLLRKLCPSCRKQYEVTPSIGHAIGVPVGTIVAAPGGCDYCRGTGYKGRIAVSEIMQVDEEVQVIINKGGSVSQIRDFCVSEKHMRLLSDSARRSVLAGVTSVDEMLALSVHHD